MNIEEELNFIRIKHKFLKENLFVDRKPSFKFDVSINGSESLGKMINIQASSSCQLKCKGCRGSFDEKFLKEAGKNSFIEDSIFKIIIQKCIESGIQYVELTPAIGDPFLDKNIENKINHLTGLSQIKLIILTTNLLKFDSKLFERLLKNDKVFLNVSIYGTNKKEYEIETGKNLFDKFLKNFKTLYTLIKKEELKGFVQLTNRTSYMLDENFPKCDILYLIDLYTRVKNVRLDGSEIFNINRAGSVNRDDLNFAKSNKDIKRSGLCPHGPGLGGGILPNGDVLFCPFNDIYRTGVIGNIFKQSLTDIYKDDKFQKIVENHNNNIYNGICAKCNETW
jgi:radical SAM protein with 4Fe4S-binding SPASM domain